MKFNFLRKIAFFAFASILVLGSCKKKDPEPVNEQEIITKVSLQFTNTVNAADVVTMTYEDSDGVGGNAPITTGGTLQKNATYDVAITVTGKDNEDITTEIAEEKEEHQIYFGFSQSTLFATFEYLDKDANNQPLGLSTRVKTVNAGGGTLQVILVHQPNKTLNTDFTPWVYSSNIGGEQDFNISLNVSIQ